MSHSIFGPENLIISYLLVSIYIMPERISCYMLFSHLIPTLILEVGAILIPFPIIENEFRYYSNFSSSARFPWSRTRDKNSKASGLLRKCFQEKPIGTWEKQSKEEERARKEET